MSPLKDVFQIFNGPNLYFFVRLVLTYLSHQILLYNWELSTHIVGVCQTSYEKMCKTEKRKQVQSPGFGLEDWIPWPWTKDSLDSSSSIPFKREGQVYSAIFKMDNQQGPTV